MGFDSRRSQYMDVISRLVIRAHCPNEFSSFQSSLPALRDDVSHLAQLDVSQRADFLALANDHHVIVRLLEMLQCEATSMAGQQIPSWCDESLRSERSRIDHAVSVLHLICEALESRECPVSVIKSLDHWPDLGSDLDLYTTADSQTIRRVMADCFQAYPVARSWGDRLANKWNFRVPGLPELVEIHVQCLGQMGEHSELARRIITRRGRKTVAGYEFHVPAPEEQIVISTLQRVYRHFYFRLCDMVDVATLFERETVDLHALEDAATCSGIWPGVATFLCLVQSYIRSYGGIIHLPEEITEAAHFPNAGVRFQGGYLRVSKRTAATLYASQLFQAGIRHDRRAVLRLPLLPSLGFCALVARGLTGSDKGVW